MQTLQQNSVVLQRESVEENIWNLRNIFPTLVLFGTPQDRCQILTWLLYEKGAQITGDLAPFIFGEKQLEEWRVESQRRYPDFELVFSANRGDDCLELIFYYQPLPGRCRFL